MLTTRLTFPPAARCLPGFGLCEITRPLLTFENFFLTLPGRQCALVSARFAVLSVLPFTFGTMQASPRVNVALTDAALFIVTLHVPVPEHAPDQPEKSEPLVAVAVSVTLVPKAYACEHAEPQLIPAGLELTLPEPDPDLFTVSVSGRSEKVAVTALACVMLTEHVPVPEQAPDQPEKAEPAPGVAASVTVVPKAYACEHVEPQLIPETFEVTVPEPEPDFVTVNVSGRAVKVAVTAFA